MDFVLNLLPHLVNGVSLGLLFALIALGFMLIVGVMEAINLAHGSLFALGAYFALFIASPKFALLPGLQDRYLAFLIAPPSLLALFLAPVLSVPFPLPPAPPRSVPCQRRVRVCTPSRARPRPPAPEVRGGGSSCRSPPSSPAARDPQR